MSNLTRKPAESFSSKFEPPARKHHAKLGSSTIHSENWRNGRANAQMESLADARRTPPAMQMQTESAGAKSKKKTCFYFAKFGSCRRPDNECQFSHFWTDSIANPPIQSLEKKAGGHRQVSGQGESSANASNFSSAQTLRKFPSNLTNEESQAPAPNMGATRGKSFSPPTGPRLPKHFSKPLTCYYWIEYGHCNKSDDDCGYAHWDTGEYSSAPIRMERGQPAIAGRNAELALEIREAKKPAKQVVEKGKARETQRPSTANRMTSFEKTRTENRQAGYAEEPRLDPKVDNQAPVMMGSWNAPARSATASPAASITPSEMVKDQHFFRDYFNSVDAFTAEDSNSSHAGRLMSENSAPIATNHRNAAFISAQMTSCGNAAQISRILYP